MKQKIKRTDFRIGNWVEDENGYYQIEPEHLEEDYFKTLQCWGVKITSEILKKVGFEFVDVAGGWCDKNHIIYELKDCWEFHPFCTNDNDLHLQIDYIHELENIYFIFNDELNSTIAFTNK